MRIKQQLKVLQGQHVLSAVVNMPGVSILSLC